MILKREGKWWWAQVVGVLQVVGASTGVDGETRLGGGLLGGSQVCTLLVEVAFDHGGGLGEMFADLCGGKFWPGGQAAGVDGIAPG